MRGLRCWLFVGSLVLILVGCKCREEGKPEPIPRDGVFIHISHGAEDPHRVLMGLNMAIKMAESHDVAVYFDIKGVEVVLRDAHDLFMEPFPSSKEALSTLMEKGVMVCACPGCLQAAGKSSEDLAEGIHVANKDHFFSFTKGRILTLDY